MNALSGYDLKYHGLSPEDRDKLSDDVRNVLMKGTEDAAGFLAKEVGKAVENMYSKLYCNPWKEVIAENGGDYNFLNELQDSVWQLMLKTKISDAGKYRVAELVAAWRANHPDDFNAAIGAEITEKIDKLTKDLEFERGFNRRNY